MNHWQPQETRKDLFGNQTEQGINTPETVSEQQANRRHDSFLNEKLKASLLKINELEKQLEKQLETRDAQYDELEKNFNLEN